MLESDWIIAATIATEVPPVPRDSFSAGMILQAIECVAEVIRNRVRTPGFPKTAVEVVLQPHQFSAVRLGDDAGNYWVHALAGLWQPQHVQRCLQIWQESASPLVPGVLWYYSPISMVPKDSEPHWLAGKEEVLVPGIDREWFRWYR